MNFICPVCFYAKLPYSPRDYHICPCCGTEFGNDDANFSHQQLREMWVAGGANWFFGRPPEGWNPWLQLLKAGFSEQYVFRLSRELKTRNDAQSQIGYGGTSDARFLGGYTPVFHADAAAQMLTNKLATICEKVIYSQAGLASLINMFTKVTIGVPNAAEIPRNAVAPKEWAIFSSWDAEPGDERREYFICVNVLYPDQSPWGDVNRTKVNIQEGRKASQVATQMVGFPVGQAGTYTIRVWIEESQRLVVNPIELSVELEIDSVQQPQ